MSARTNLFHLAFLLGAGLAAGEPEDRKKPEATVTVTAEATPVEVAKTPNPVRVIEGDELARLQVRTLADLLAVLAPGAAMPAGGPGKQASAFLNGTLSRNVVILLDGLRLNDATDVSPNLGALGLLGIERVEVLLGPASTLYGSDAIGGVIHLRSAGADRDGLHGRAFLLGGTAAQAGAGAAVQARGGWGWLAAGAEATRQGSDFPGDDLRQAGAFFRGGRRFGAFDLTLSYRNTGQTVATPFDVQYLPPAYDAVRVYVPDRESRARQQRWSADLRFEASKTLAFENAAGVTTGDSGDPAGRGRVQRDRSFRRFEDQLSAHWTPAAGFRLSGRLEGRVDTSEARNYYDPVLFGTVQYRGEGRHLAAAAEARWELRPGLDWTAGLRREAAHLDLTRVATEARSPVGRAEATTLRTGLNWTLRPSLRLYASYGQGFRMPNLVEYTLNAQAGVVDGRDYGLAPERGRTLQAGATGSLGGGFDVRLEAQRTRLSNLLAYRYDPTFSGAFTDHYENAGNVQAQSLEGALLWRGGSALAWGWDLVLRSNDTRDLDHNTPSDRYGARNTAIVRHPFFTASAAAFAGAGPWRADLRLDRVGPRYDVQDVPSFRVIGAKAFTELSVSLAWAFPSGLSLQLRGEHLLQPKQNVPDWTSGAFDGDGNASLVYGYPAPGPRASLSATYRW
jgi:outer membrane cobalamin receptor